MATKINITFFVDIDVLNMFHLTIKKKKNDIFQNSSEKLFLVGHDHFWRNGAPDDKNEYNLLFGKWGTGYSF